MTRGYCRFAASCFAFRYQVLPAEGGAEGLRLLRKKSVSLVVLDYYMADMNGEQVAAEIKRIRPTVPILLWSAYIDLPESAFTQVDAYLLKCEPVETLWLLSRNCCSEQ